MRLSCKRRHVRVTVGSNSVMCDAYCRSEMQGSATLLRIQGELACLITRTFRISRSPPPFCSGWQLWLTTPTFTSCLQQRVKGDSVPDDVCSWAGCPVMTSTRWSSKSMIFSRNFCRMRASLHWHLASHWPLERNPVQALTENEVN